MDNAVKLYNDVSANCSEIITKSYSTSFSLGIYTLVSGLNIFLASAHQITSVLLVFSALNLYYLRTK